MKPGSGEVEDKKNIEKFFDNQAKELELHAKAPPSKNICHFVWLNETKLVYIYEPDIFFIIYR